VFFKKKNQLKSIDVKAKELRNDNYESYSINPNSESMELIEKINNPEEGVRDINIKLIERDSPLSAHFIKVDLCNDIRLRVLDEYEKVDDTFGYTKNKSKVKYASLDPMNSFEKEDLLVRNKVVNIKNISQLSSKARLSYTSRTGVKCNIKLNVTAGILSEK
jgi:hypothetical protein